MHVIDAAPEVDQPSSDSPADALVLIHGASTSSLDFSTNLLPALSRSYRVAAIDRPGHGYSDRGSSPDMHDPVQQANAILETLERMYIRHPVLIGHSWAGSVVLAALLAEGSKVEPVAGVLIAGVSHPWDREDSRPTKLALAPFFGPLFTWQYLAPIGRMAIAPTVERVFAPDEVPENYIHDTGLYLSLRPDTYRYNALDRTNLSDHLIAQSNRYRQINTPLLSIAAIEDHVVPPYDHHDKLIEAVADVKAVMLAGAGHSPHHTRTDDVVSSIETFIEGLQR